MKAKVLIPFRDRVTKKAYDKKGAEIELTTERFNEILKTGKFVEAIKETNKPTSKA